MILTRFVMLSLFLKTTASIGNMIKTSIEVLCASLWQLVIAVRKQGEFSQVILYYHDIPMEATENFRRQMRFLARKNCRAVSVTEFLKSHRGDRHRLVALAFDDAFVSVIENAIPILRQFGFTATVFVPMGCLNAKPEWDMRKQDRPDDHEYVASAEQLQWLKSQGFEIQSHAWSHTRLSGLGPEELTYELTRSKSALEEVLGTPVEMISYPFGDYNSAVCARAAQVGYRHGLTIEPRPVNDCSNPMKVGRFSVSPSDSLYVFNLKTSGGYDIVWYLKCIKKVVRDFVSRR